MHPVAAPSAALVAEAAQVVALVVANVAVAGNVDPVIAASVVVFIQIAFPLSTRPGAEVVIHKVVSQLLRIIAQAVRKAVGGRIKQNSR